MSHLTAKDIFLAALEQPSPENRDAYVAEACGSDHGLRQRVAALLRAHEDSGGLARDLPLEADEFPITEDPTQPFNDQTGEVIAGRYRLLEPIGEGGMGSVWVAQQSEPVRRKVAVKLIKPGMDSKQVLARFQAERQALALMDHPNIAKVFDGGITEQGRPYFVMEYVKGIPITQYCDNARLSLQERLKLFVLVCQAVQHAHQKGIIHRDMKPSNILVCLYDGQPVPKVIDFGLAKAMHQSLTDQSIHTAHGIMVGTPLYMSPEQAEFNNLDIDTRSDIYSLGVVLYELLTGSTPLEKQQLKDAVFNEVLRLIKEVEPPKPSTRLSGSASLPNVAAQRSLNAGQLKRSLQGDLDWIVMKSLEKERSRRYETANGLARDIHRYLNDEAVEACPPSAAYRWRKFARKHRLAIRTAGAFVLLLATATGISTWLAVRATRAERMAKQLAEHALASAKRAEEAEMETMDAYRASTDDAIEQLIGSKADLGVNEKTYLENTLKRWQVFAERQGDDERSKVIRAEGRHRVAFLWNKFGAMQKAREEFEQARTIRQQLVEQFPAVPEYQRDLARTRNSLGATLMSLGRIDEALGEFQRATEILEALADQFPSVPEYRARLAMSMNNLANVFFTLGELDKAETEIRAACMISERLVEEFPNVEDYAVQCANWQSNLGLFLARAGNTKEAETWLLTAIQTSTTLIAAYPSNPVLQKCLARTQNTLGSLYQNCLDYDKAENAFQTSRQVWMNLTSQFPAVTEFQEGLAQSRYNLGFVMSLGLSKEDKHPSAWDKAVNELKAARDIQTRLHHEHPSEPGYAEDLAGTWQVLGSLSKVLGDYETAELELQTARDIQQRLVDQYPNVPNYRLRLGHIYVHIGALFGAEGNIKECRNWTKKAFRLVSPIHESHSRDVDANQVLKEIYLISAEANDAFGEYAEAVENYEKAIPLSAPSERPSIRANRAYSQIRAGMVADAIAEVTDLAISETWDAHTWYRFACIYSLASAQDDERQMEYGNRAMKMLKHAIDAAKRAGIDEFPHADQDPDLAAIRDRDDFRKLFAKPKEDSNTKLPSSPIQNGDGTG